MARGARRHQSSTAPARWRLGLVALLVVGVTAALYLALRPKPKAPVPASAGQVESAVTQEGDSLRVVVQWTLAAPGPEAESLRVEVRVDSMHTTATRIRRHPRPRQRDTLYVPAPRPGETAEGLSCVATQHRSITVQEICTAWRYVRPLAEQPGARSRGRRSGGRGRGAEAPVRIVVRPSGLQVDPDIGGRCAEWQRGHPTMSVWIEVNRVAVPACTGPNRRPTVAQFCAFAELADGRRVKTANSANNPYCDQLFRVWERERLS